MKNEWFRFLVVILCAKALFACTPPAKETSNASLSPLSEDFEQAEKTIKQGLHSLKGMTIEECDQKFGQQRGQAVIQFAGRDDEYMAIYNIRGNNLSLLFKDRRVNLGRLILVDDTEFGGKISW